MNSGFKIDCGEILLREFRVEDVDAIYEITSQPEVYEFLPDWKSTKEQRLEWVTNYEIPSNVDITPRLGSNHNTLVKSLFHAHCWINADDTGSQIY